MHILCTWLSIPKYKQFQNVLASDSLKNQGKGGRKRIEKSNPNPMASFLSETTCKPTKLAYTPKTLICMPCID